MYFLDDHPEIVNNILDYLNRKPRKSADQIYGVIKDKYEGKNPTIYPIVSSLEALNFIVANERLFSLTERGYEVLKVGGYLSFRDKELERKALEDRYYKINMSLAENAKKTFWVTFSAGILGFVFSVILGVREIIRSTNNEFEEPQRTEEELKPSINEKQVESMDDTKRIINIDSISK